MSMAREHDSITGRGHKRNDLSNEIQVNYFPSNYLASNVFGIKLASTRFSIGNLQEELTKPKSQITYSLQRTAYLNFRFLSFSIIILQIII